MKLVRERSGPADKNCVLQDRDRRLMVDLFLHRTMSRDQIVGLGYFGSVPRCNDRLRRLLDHGFVQRYQHSSRGSGSQALYRVGKGARAYVAGAVEVPVEEVTWQVEKDSPVLFLDHTLGLVDLRIAFGRAADRLGLEEYEWLVEPLCRHEYSVKQAGSWVRHVLRPDAFVGWSLKGKLSSNFLELDFGNVSQRTFERKVDSYCRYLKLGIFREAYSADSFAVLIITAGDRRLRNLLQLVGSRTLFGGAK